MTVAPSDSVQLVQFLKNVKLFSELSPEELRSLETALKKVGKRAAALTEES